MPSRISKTDLHLITLLSSWEQDDRPVLWYRITCREAVGNQSPWQQLAPEESESLSSKCWGKITSCLKSISCKTSLQGIPRNQSGKILLARQEMQETQVQSGGEDLPEEVATHSVFLSGGSRGQKAWWATVLEVTKSHDWAPSTHTYMQEMRENTHKDWGNVLLTPLQSGLETSDKIEEAHDYLQPGILFLGICPREAF